MCVYSALCSVRLSPMTRSVCLSRLIIMDGPDRGWWMAHCGPRAFCSAPTLNIAPLNAAAMLLCYYIVHGAVLLGKKQKEGSPIRFWSKSRLLIGGVDWKYRRWLIVGLGDGVWSMRSVNDFCIFIGEKINFVSIRIKV